jgi:phage terminase large subunit GpA-like protein
MNKSEILFSAFRSACRPPVKMPPSEWATGRVALYEGLSPTYQADSAPWLREPLDAFADIDAKEVCLLAPVGTGKTTMIEAALSFVISEDPGGTMIVGQTDADIKDWAETRMQHTLRNTKETAGLLPTGKHRHKLRKDAIIFPHMSMFLTGANMSGLNAKSMRRVLCDEVWMWEKGMIREAQGRLHDRWNRQFYLLSQGGYVGDDWHKKWAATSQHEFSFCCPSCQTWQGWRWENVVYDDTIADRVTMAQTARIKCSNADCDYHIEDKPQIRRELATAGKYIQQTDGMPDSKGYHYSVLANWRLPLWRLVIERCEAMDEVSRGNLDLLRQFIQKRLAEFWSDEQEDNRVTLSDFGYLLSDYDQAQPIDDEAQRFFTLDRQADHFWGVIRAWRADGSSRLLWFGKIDTWERCKVIQETYKVENRKTQIDCGYQKDEVYKRCAQYDWLALRGDARDSYPHPTKSGKPVYKSYSRYQNVTSSDGKKTMVCYWSNLHHKDILFQLRNQKGVAWEIPDDAGREYLRQIDAEVRRGEGKTAVWKKRHNDNHATDCEAMQIVLASMFGLIGTRQENDESE